MSERNRQKVHVPLVLHVVVSLAPGGLERLVVDWTNARNGMHPGSTSICCLDESGALADAVEGDCVRVLNARRSRFPFDVSAVWRLRRVILAARMHKGTQEGAAACAECLQSPVSGLQSPLVVHSHNLSSWQYAAMAARLAGVRHVHTEHGTNPHFRGTVNRLRNAFLVRETDAIVAVAGNTADALVRQQGICRSQIRVIRNGVVDVALRPTGREEIRKRYGIPPGMPVIGSVGRLADVKGQDRLLRAFAALRKTCDCHLLLVGDGPAREAQEELATEAGITDSVTWAGYQDDVRGYLDAMDLFVLPSRSEGLPVALLEAMLAGVPVAATHVGEVSEVLAHGRAGHILPDDDAEWGSSLFRLLEDVESGETAQTVDMARRLVRELYSQASTLEQYESTYNDVVSTRT